MKMQFRPAIGRSFWDLSGTSVPVLEYVGRDRAWVEWQGRVWLRKYRARSICEVLGYQIADALELPLQPWAAFFQPPKATTRTRLSGAGILVERWPHCARDVALWELAKTHPDAVGRALALGVLDRSEWPRWLVSDVGEDLRLFDLEFVGPGLSWPPQRTRLDFYRKTTGQQLEYTRRKADEVGIAAVFQEHLEILTRLDFSRVLDTTGLPHALTIKKVMVRGLEKRQWEIRRILDGAGSSRGAPGSILTTSSPQRLCRVKGMRN
jgi:hypothetical protein